MYRTIEDRHKMKKTSGKPLTMFKEWVEHEKIQSHPNSRFENGSLGLSCK